jgi:hypothetical protein
MYVCKNFRTDIEKAAAVSLNCSVTKITVIFKAENDLCFFLTKNWEILWIKEDLDKIFEWSATPDYDIVLFK